MFVNLLKIALRNLFRLRVYSILNIAGLSIGLASVLMIFLWVEQEFSFDKFHQHSDSIHILYEKQYFDKGEVFPVYSTPSPLANALKRDFTQVKHSSRWAGSLKKLFVKVNGNTYQEERVRMVDPDFFKMFSFSILKGEQKNPFIDDRSLVISQSTAIKYFGDENPVGQEVVVNRQYVYHVTAVVEDPGDYSSLKFDILAPFDLFVDLYEFDSQEWKINLFWTFIQLDESVQAEEVELLLKDYIKIHDKDSSVELKMQPLTRMHLFSVEKVGSESILYVWVFSIVAVLILLIACFNFMNLATARSGQRAREVGIRKAVGANRTSLVVQFLSESICFTIVAMVFAVVLVELMLPFFNGLTSRPVTFDLSDLRIWKGIALIILSTGILAGIYPSWFMSSFIPVNVLKGMPRLKWGAIRKSLVVMQFAMSVALIICTAFIYLQNEYLQQKDVGFSKHDILYVELSQDFIGQYPVVKEEFLKIPGVLSVTAASQMPVNIDMSTSDVSWYGKRAGKDIMFQLFSVDVDFIETFEMEIIQGQGFNYHDDSDSLEIILNKEAVRRIGMVNPIGEELSIWGDKGYIVGVVNDFNSSGLQLSVEPLILLNDPSAYRFLAIKIRDKDRVKEQLSYVWNNNFEDIPFNCRFLESDFLQLYDDERQMVRIFKCFAILAIIISAMGLFGLSSFVAERRTKEMGVRKIMGASGSEVFILLIRQFIVWIALANVIAWPVAYLLVSKWLDTFAYHIDINIGVFLFSASVSLVIAFLTVVWQAYRLAVSNPVNAIKYE